MEGQCKQAMQVKMCTLVSLKSEKIDQIQALDDLFESFTGTISDNTQQVLTAITMYQGLY